MGDMTKEIIGYDDHNNPIFNIIVDCYKFGDRYPKVSAEDPDTDNIIEDPLICFSGTTDQIRTFVAFLWRSMELDNDKIYHNKDWEKY